MLLSHKNEDALTNQKLIKENNIKRVFSLVNKNSFISRAIIAQELKLSPTTVSALVDELIENNIIYTYGEGEKHTSGRKPIMLKINPEGAQIITAAWHKKGFKYVLYDLCCNELESFYIKTDQCDDYADCLYNGIISGAKKLNINDVKAFCVSLSGIVDQDSKKIVSTTLPLDEEDDFIKKLKEKIKEIPLVVTNDSTSLVYAEKEHEKNKTNNLIYIYIGEGVGAGIICDGTVFRGARSQAGEFGHTSIDMNGPECSCGNRGCIEKLINTNLIIDRLKLEIKAGRLSILTDLCCSNLEDLTLDKIGVALNKEDSLTLEIIDDMSEKLAFGINNLISIFNPEEVVIGGGIESLGAKFIKLVQDKVRVRGFLKMVSGVAIRYTYLTSSGENLGAAQSFIDNIMTFTISNNDEIIIF